jgi:hypothetical protein
LRVVRDACSETKATKAQEEANVESGLSICKVSAWQMEMSQSKARESEKAKKERRCKEREMSWRVRLSLGLSMLSKNEEGAFCGKKIWAGSRWMLHLLERRWPKRFDADKKP